MTFAGPQIIRRVSPSVLLMMATPSHPLQMVNLQRYFCEQESQNGKGSMESWPIFESMRKILSNLERFLFWTGEQECEEKQGELATMKTISSIIIIVLWIYGVEGLHSPVIWKNWATIGEVDLLDSKTVNQSNE